MRLLRPVVLASLAAAVVAADAVPAPVAPAPAATPPAAAPPAPSAQPTNADAADEATRIAADVIKSRALDAAGAGQLDLAVQLQALAKGLLEGRVTLYDASLVMQIAAAPRTAAPTTLTPDARASARRATDLLDGGTAAPAAPTAPSPAPGQPLAALPGPSGQAQPGSATAPAVAPAPTGDAAKPIISKVYATDVGSDGKANVAAIGVGSRVGIQVGHRFVLKRRDLIVAQAKVVSVKESLCYAEIIKGSLVDPRDDVREGDQALLER